MKFNLTSFGNLWIRHKNKNVYIFYNPKTHSFRTRDGSNYHYKFSLLIKQILDVY